MSDLATKVSTLVEIQDVSQFNIMNIEIPDIVTNSPFIHKYQPIYFRDFEQLDPTTITLMKSLISLNNLNILIIR